MASPNIVKAVELLGSASRYFDIWAIAGAGFKRLRGQIMAELVGHKVPLANCGVNALREAFYAVAKPAGECAHEREAAFEAWARKLLGIG